MLPRFRGGGRPWNPAFRRRAAICDVLEEAVISLVAGGADGNRGVAGLGLADRGGLQPVEVAQHAVRVGEADVAQGPAGGAEQRVGEPCPSAVGVIQDQYLVQFGAQVGGEHVAVGAGAEPGVVGSAQEAGEDRCGKPGLRRW